MSATNGNGQDAHGGRDERGEGDEERIEEGAGLWFARREAGMSREEEREFQAWLRADPRHAPALARMEQASAILEKLPFAAGRLGPPAAESKDEPAARAEEARRWWPVFAAAAAAVALATTVWWRWPESQPAPLVFATSAGGYERAALADGSVLELNASSAAEVRFTPGRRAVTLTKGEGHFSVAHDPARPFVVSAGSVAVRAVGTAFNVRLAAGEVEVLVTEGKVSVTPAERVDKLDTPEKGAPMVVAGERAVVERTSEPRPAVVEKIGPGALRQALAWQERKLVFAETPLRDVVEQFNRRNLTQLRIADEELAARPVGGTFAADNVAAFVRLLETAGDIVAEPVGEREIVLRKAR